MVKKNQEKPKAFNFWHFSKLWVNSWDLTLNSRFIAGEVCAAKFVDDEWYRVKVEKVTATEATVLYMDYGNRATIPKAKCGNLPASFLGLPAFAKEYALAFMTLAPDVSFFQIYLDIRCRPFQNQFNIY